MRALAAVQVAFAAVMGLSISNAKSLDHGQAGAQALELAKRAIALRSVRGPGNQTPEVASLFKSALVAGGFADEDVTITPVDDTAFLIARWKGSDPKLKPIVISGHMDVVEARPSDWERDPFTPIVENGLLFGRGCTHRIEAAGVQAASRNRPRVFGGRRDDDEDDADDRQCALELRDGAERRWHWRAAGPAGQAAVLHLVRSREDLWRF